jgi:serine/threonine-protein kinase
MALLPGSRYEALLKISSGGQATVYVARPHGAVGLARLVAVKRLHAELRESPRARALLIREGMLAARISDPHVVTIRDVEELEDEILLVMDYVEGAALSDLLERAAHAGPAPSLGVALRVLLDACMGLCAIHSAPDGTGRARGLVHRDLSPHNVLVDVRGHALITDFGLAKVVDLARSRSSARQYGKVAYLAPEYLSDRPYTPRADLFSLGVVMWETLAGRRLFAAPHPAVALERVLLEPAPDLDVARVPAALGGLVARLLDKRPEGRPASADEVLRALEAVAARAGAADRSEVAEWLGALVGGELAERRALLRGLVDDEPSDTAALELDQGAVAAGPSATERSSASGETEASDMTTTQVRAQGPPGAVAELREESTTVERAGGRPHGGH